jgi:hypothetical protein
MYYSKRKLGTLLIATGLFIGICTLKYCQSPRYKEKRDNMDRKTLNELIDFADSTKQLQYIGDIIQYYNASYKHCKDEMEAFKQTIKTYDLSWHPDYKLIFEDYHRKRDELYKKDTDTDDKVVF